MPLGSSKSSQGDLGACGLQRVQEKAGHRHGSYTAGDGCDPCTLWGHLTEVHVAGEALSPFPGWIVDAVEARRTLPETVAVAHAAAAETRDRKALRGRASFLGDRSIGHVDPGARSSALIVEAIAGALL